MPKEVKNICGIDPDSKNITVFMMNGPKYDYHNVLSGKGQRAEDRIEQLYLQFAHFVQGRSIDYAYVEKPVFGVNAKSAISQAYVVGMIRGILWHQNIPHSLVDNTIWKKAMLGSGHASKEDIAAFAKARFKLPDKLPQDVYDAAVICAWGHERLP